MAIKHFSRLERSFSFIILFDCERKPCWLSSGSDSGPRGETKAKMFTTSPFAQLSASIPVALMQAYLVVMILLVVGGTLLDVGMKKSAKYFFGHWRDAQNKGKRRVGGGEMVLLAAQTAAVDVLT